MTEFDAVTRQIALTLGVAWASGINLYAAVATLGLLGATGSMALPTGLETLSNPLVIGAAVLMYVVEFFADKIPGVDTAWDVLHTFIRIPAGAALAAGSVGNVDPAVAVAAGLVGGTVAGTMHATKAGTRLLLNASPEPFSNAIASVVEDVGVFGGLWMMNAHPAAFVALLVAGLAALCFVLPRLWRGVTQLAARVAGFLRGRGFGPGAAPPNHVAAGATPHPDEDQRPTV